MKQSFIGYVATNEPVSIAFLELLNNLGLSIIHKNGYIHIYREED